MTTLHDVALAAGVSDATVSRALRGLDSVRPATRQAVEHAAKRLNFTLSRSASSLASSRSMRVEMLFGNPLNTWFSSNCMQGVYEVVSRAGYDVVPVVINSYRQLYQFLDRLPATRRNMDGLIVPSFALEASDASQLGALNLPAVGLDAPGSTALSAATVLDNRGAMRTAVQYLLRLGHRRIGFVEHPSPAPFHASSRQRGRFFREEALSLGLEAESLSYFETEADAGAMDVDEANARMAARVLEAEPRPTALCVETDSTAIDMIGRLRALGARVPEDISVVGFDDDDQAALAGLTTLRQNPLEMARLTARKLLTLMEGGELEEPRTLIRTTLIPRATTQAVEVRESSRA